MAKKVKENKIENRATFSPAVAALIKDSLKPNEVLCYGEGETELKIEVAHSVSVGRKAEAIRRAADLLFQDDTTDMSGFMAGFREFAKRFGVLLCYTDIEFPSDLSSVWAMVLYTPIFNDVSQILGEELVLDFIWGFQELVEARKQEIIHSIGWSKILDRVLSKIEKLPEAIFELLKNIDLKKFGIENLAELTKILQENKELDAPNILEMFTKKK